MMDDPLRELEPRLKKILYKCTETIRASKAALYLSRAGKPYELVTQYGFQNGVIRKIAGNHPIPARLMLTKAPFFVNGIKTDPRFAEILYETNSEMLLASPILLRGQLIGFIDMRDKRGEKRFTEEDLEQSAKIVQAFFELFAVERLFGMRSPTETEAKEKPRVDLTRMIHTADQVVNRSILEKSSLGTILTEREITPVAIALQTILTLPGTVLAAFSAFGHLGNVQPVVVRGTLMDDAKEKLDEKLRAWLTRHGVPVPDEPSRTQITSPEGLSGPPVTAARLNSILSAPVSIENMTGLVLSVGFESQPDKETQQKLTTHLDQIQQTIIHSISHHSVNGMRQRAAERLLQPDFSQFPELEDHSKRVSDLAERFAHYLELPSSEAELLRLAAYLHDVGMRLLDYENLYKKPELTNKELELIRSHPVVSAALIARSALGPDIAEIVLYHHERPDGTGYPKGLTGPQIPESSRILALCEAFIAMTAPNGYQPPMPESSAITLIRQSAGTQFDKELATKFVDMLEEPL